MKISLVLCLGLLFSVACKPSPGVVVEPARKSGATNTTDSVASGDDKGDPAPTANDDFLKDGTDFGIKCEPVALPDGPNGEKKVQLGCRAGGGAKTEMGLTAATYVWEFQKVNSSNIVVVYPTTYNTSRYQYVVVVSGSSDALLYQYLAATRVSLRAERLAASGARVFGYLSVLAGSKEAGALPHNFKVYETDGGVSSVYSEGAVEKTLKTVNRSYLGSNGCYVACYSREAADSTFAVGEGIYVKGQVRVKGGYDEQNICRPEGYEAADISAMKEFGDKCRVYLSSCDASSDCWAGGDTGGWL